MAKIERSKKRSKRGMMKLVSSEGVLAPDGGLNSRLLLIQQLIPLGLEAVNEELQSEVTRLVGGASHERTGGSMSRWGSNPGSVVLGGQKVSVSVPRVRDLCCGQEVSLESYRELRRREGICSKGGGDTGPPSLL